MRSKCQDDSACCGEEGVGDITPSQDRRNARILA
jgi:hypothetical protein